MTRARGPLRRVFLFVLTNRLTKWPFRTVPSCKEWLKWRLRARSSAGEHSLHTRGVAGSIPAAPITDTAQTGTGSTVRMLSKPEAMLVGLCRAISRRPRAQRSAAYLGSLRPHERGTRPRSRPCGQRNCGRGAKKRAAFGQRASIKVTAPVVQETQSPASWSLRSHPSTPDWAGAGVCVVCQSLPRTEPG
jgi:hypothetical protein